MVRSRKGRISGYLGLVVIPVILTVSFGSWRWLQQSSEFYFDRYQRGVTAAAALLAQDMGTAQRELADRAPVVEVAQPYPSAVQRALAGDTVTGLASSDTNLELTLVVADPDGAIRMIREPFAPPFLEVLPSVTGLSMSIYLRGSRSATTDRALAPLILSPDLINSLVGSSKGVRYIDEGFRGILRGMESSPVTSPQLVLLAGEANSDSGGRWLLTLLPILAIVLTLAVTSAWTIARSTSGERGSRPPAVQFALIAFIPVLAGGAILLAFDQQFRGEVFDIGVQDLAQAAITVQQLDLPITPGLLRRVTGFDIALTGPEGLGQSTLDDPALLSKLSDLALPPPNWMTSGLAETPSVSVHYEMVRVGSNQGLIFIRNDLIAKVTSLRTYLLKISLLMLVPSAFFLLIEGLKSRQSTVQKSKSDSP